MPRSCSSPIRPAELPLAELLRTFWEEHDPTQGMRQGNDVGTQYRSAIYYTTPEQGEIVRASRDAYQAALAARNRGLITTEIAEAGPFYPAEEYHQQYLQKNPGGYCGLAGTGVSCPIGVGVPPRASYAVLVLSRGAARCAPRRPGRRARWQRAARRPRRSGSAGPRAGRGARRRTRAGAAAAPGAAACGRRRLDAAEARVHVAEREALGARADHRAVRERVGRAAVVQQRGGRQDVDVEARLPLRGLAAERRDRDGVLDQPARVGVVSRLGRRGRAEARAVGRVAEDPLDDAPQRVVVDLGDQEVEVAVEVVDVATRTRHQLERVAVGQSLDVAQLELDPALVAADASEHAHGVTGAEASVEQLDRLPDARPDAAAAVCELDVEVGAAVPARSVAPCASRRRSPRPATRARARAPSFHRPLPQRVAGRAATLRRCRRQPRPRRSCAPSGRSDTTPPASPRPTSWRRRTT